MVTASDMGRIKELQRERDQRAMAECSFTPTLIATMPWHLSQKRYQGIEPSLGPGPRMYAEALEARKKWNQHLHDLEKVCHQTERVAASILSNGSKQSHLSASGFDVVLLSLLHTLQVLQNFLYHFCGTRHPITKSECNEAMSPSKLSLCSLRAIAKPKP